jgi:hypothetical protein
LRIQLSFHVPILSGTGVLSGLFHPPARELFQNLSQNLIYIKHLIKFLNDMMTDKGRRGTQVLCGGAVTLAIPEIVDLHTGKKNRTDPCTMEEGVDIWPDGITSQSLMSSMR